MVGPFASGPDAIERCWVFGNGPKSLTTNGLGPHHPWEDSPSSEWAFGLWSEILLRGPNGLEPNELGPGRSMAQPALGLTCVHPVCCLRTAPNWFERNGLGSHTRDPLAHSLESQLVWTLWNGTRRRGIQMEWSPMNLGQTYNMD